MHPHPEQAGTDEAKARTRRRARSGGVVMVEYAFLLAAFGIPVMIGTAAAGVALVRGYGNVRNDILHEFP